MCFVIMNKPFLNFLGSVRSSEGLLHGVYASCILLLLIFTFTLIFFIWKMRLRLGEFVDR